MPERYTDFLIGVITDLEDLIRFDPCLSRNEAEKSFEILKKILEVLNDA